MSLDPWKWSIKERRIFAAIFFACLLVWILSIVVVTAVKGEFRAQSWVRLTPIPFLLGFLLLFWLAFSEKYGRKKAFFVALWGLVGLALFFDMAETVLVGLTTLASGKTREPYSVSIFYRIIALIAFIIMAKRLGLTQDEEENKK